MSNLEFISSNWLSNAAVEAVNSLPGAIRESILQTKQEQTFSSLLVSRMNHEQLNTTTSMALVEIRGRSVSAKQRNTHDIAILSHEGKKLCIIENKVWYHFDGAKGRIQPKVEKDVVDQLATDIEKIQLTLRDEEGNTASGFVLLNVVTPQETSLLPYSYRNSQNTALKREKGSISSLMKSGLNGIVEALAKFRKEVLPYSHSFQEFSNYTSRMDAICAEVRNLR